MSKTSNPQKRRKSIHNRPVFAPNFSSGGTGIDLVSGTIPGTAINGARYGIVNGVVSSFAPNIPPIEDEGLRGCPAFTQLAKYTDYLTNAVWTLGSGATGVSRPGGDRLIYSGGSSNINLLQQSIAVAGGTASKILTAVARVSSSSYPQKFRIKNTHLGVIDTFSDNITITKPTSLYLRVQNSASAGTGSQQIGIAASTDNKPLDINIGMNLAEANFIYPYTPNNSGSSVSVVSEAGNTSFDLDAPALSRFKKGLQGPNAQGHFELEVESNVDSGWVANGTNIGIFSVNDNAGDSNVYYRKLSGGGSAFYLYENVTNNVFVDIAPISVGQTYRISLDYGTYTDGTQKMRLTVNGVKSPVVAFSGSFGSQDLRFFYGNTVHAGWIKDIKYYDRPRW